MAKLSKEEKELIKEQRAEQKMRKRAEQMKLMQQFWLVSGLFVLVCGIWYFSGAENHYPDWLKGHSPTMDTMEYREPTYYHKNEVHALRDTQRMLENDLQVALNKIEVTKDNERELKLLQGYIDDLKTGRLTIDTSVDLKYLIDEAIEEAYAKYPLATPNKLRAIMKQESQFNPLAISHAGAMGLMQLMPSTAEWLGVANPWDVKQNIMGGAQYLSDQLKATNGDFRRALSYYNAGPNAPLASNGIADNKETQKYVPIVLKNYYEYESHDAKARKGIK